MSASLSNHFAVAKDGAAHHPSCSTAKKPKTTKPKPFSLRLSPDERDMLDRMAGNRPVGAFIRSKLFGELAAPRKLHQRRSGLDHKMLAQALALLGQSRIASNLNQLAKAANIGALPVDDELTQELHEACLSIQVMRHELISALGLKSD